MSEKTKREKRMFRRRRVRSRIRGDASRPRLSVFRSNRGLTVQAVDDTAGRTLAAASDREVRDAKTKKKQTLVERARAVGALVAKRLREKDIATAVFDRGGYAYHGAVAAAAEGAREGGLKI